MSTDAFFQMLTAEAIFSRRLVPEHWSLRPVLALVIELLPTIEDDLAADLVEHLALALVERGDELRAVRTVLASSLDLSHKQRIEIVSLRLRLVDMLEARRRERTAA